MIQTLEDFSKKHNRLILGLFFVIIFLIYFLIEFISVMIINSLSFDTMFGSDSPRVLWDWTNKYFDHHRTSTHPLYVLLVFPIIKVFNIICFNENISVILFLSIISTLNVFLVYLIIKKILKGKSFIITFLFSIFYAISFSQLENALLIESFTLSAFTLLLFWCWFIYNKSKNFKWYDYVVLSLLGTLCFAILTTNYIHFLIGLSFIFIFKKQESFKGFMLNALKLLIVVLGSLGVSYILIRIQKALFPSCVDSMKYVIDTLYGFFTKTNTTQDNYFLRLSVSSQSFYNIFISYFGLAFFGGRFENKWQINALPSVLTWIFAVAIIIVFVFMVIISLKNKRFIVLPFLLSFIFECIIHIFYGNGELMLYLPEAIFLLIICTAIGFSTMREKYQNYFIYGLFGTILLEFINNFVVICVLFSIMSKVFSDTAMLFSLKDLIFFINILLVINMAIIIKNRLREGKND